MRVALIADLHGNLPALEAVLDELEGEEIDQLVCLGDVAVGPQPAETLARLRDLGCPVVLGNWDAWFVEGVPALEAPDADKLVEMGEWWAAQLSADDRAFIATFRPTYTIDLGDGASVLCFHGSPRSFVDWIIPATPDADLETMLDGARDTVLAGGHTHLPVLRRHRGSLFVNPGSVGLPFREQPGPIRVERFAEYGVVDANDGRVSVDLRRTSYDVDAFLERALASGVPHAEWWVDCWTEVSE